MNLYTIFTIIVSLAALFAYINHRFIKLPSTIGIMILSLATSIGLVLTGSWYPELFSSATEIIKSLDFYDLVINMMLSFLLFAGAIHINAERLKKERMSVMVFATLGTVISTAIVGVAMFFLFGIFNRQVDIIYCLLFGALISPTDPIAVLGILKKTNIPQSLEMKISGESLFNDGVGVVIFLTLLEIARLGINTVSALDITLLFIKEAGGGILFGLILGYVGFRLLKSVDNYQVEVLMTLAIVMGGYSMASALHVSGPLAMVVAGIITGNQGRTYGMSDLTRDYLGKFWELIDEILNAILFLLIGLEIIVIPLDKRILIIGSISILVVLLARLISVYLPVALMKKIVPFENKAVTMLTWGGLRGAISVALALSLPVDMMRNEFVSITYIIVVFSIIVQGLTIGKLAKKIY